MLNVRVIYLVALLARVARQWMKERGISRMRVKCRVHIFSSLFGSIVDERTRNKLYGVKFFGVEKRHFLKVSQLLLSLIVVIYRHGICAEDVSLTVVLIAGTIVG